MAARISEIFLYKEYGKCFFFIKKPNLAKKIWRLEEEGWGVVKVSDFFLFSKESKL